MNRRDFLKSALTVAALSPLTRLAGQSGVPGTAPDGIARPAPDKVTRRRFRTTGLTIPLLGFGMMRLPRQSPNRPDIDAAKAGKMVDRAMAAGLNYFDTAYMYHKGKSETFAGKALKKYPRDSFLLADKMPVWMAGNPAGIKHIFQEQLDRCQTEYFDFYLIHSLNAANWERALKFKVPEFLEEQKAKGKIRYLGFSFHDSPEVLKTIAGARPWDFAQIQLNYLDWEAYRSREQYEILTELGIPVIVMEPLRGGALAKLTPEATAILQRNNPGASTASWALRYAASLPNVICVLSGMTLPEHLEDNLRTFTPFKPLSDAERQTLQAALQAHHGAAVPCTACNYCVPCPVGVEIPRIFSAYNQYRSSGDARAFLAAMAALGEDGRPGACVNCGRCARHCPQKIKIPDELKAIDSEYRRLQKA